VQKSVSSPPPLLSVRRPVTVILTMTVCLPSPETTITYPQPPLPI
jgi:hypothetical protein